MLILEENDKWNISHMSHDATKYVAFPDKENQEDIQRWMRHKPFNVENET